MLPILRRAVVYKCILLYCVCSRNDEICILLDQVDTVSAQGAIIKSQGREKRRFEQTSMRFQCEDACGSVANLQN